MSNVSDDESLRKFPRILGVAAAFACAGATSATAAPLAEAALNALAAPLHLDDGASQTLRTIEREMVAVIAGDASLAAVLADLPEPEILTSCSGKAPSPESKSYGCPATDSIEFPFEERPSPAPTDSTAQPSSAGSAHGETAEPPPPPLDVNRAAPREAHSVSYTRTRAVPGLSASPDTVWPALFAATLILFAPWLLYRRLTRDRVLDNATRAAVFERIVADPGATAGALARALSLDRKTVEHHLDVLREVQLIEAKALGARRHYFRNGGAYTDAEKRAIVARRRENAGAILERLREGESLRCSARALGLPKSTVESHVRRLRRLGLLAAPHPPTTVTIVGSHAVPHLWETPGRA